MRRSGPDSGPADISAQRPLSDLTVLGHHDLHRPGAHLDWVCFLSYADCDKPGTSRSCPVRQRHTGVDSAFDFQTQVPHGPGAVRVLIYRLCDSRERVQLTVRNPLGRGLPPPSSKKICDLPVTPVCQTEQAKTSI